MINDEVFIHDGWQIVMRLKNGEVQNRYLWGAKQDELLCKNNEWTLGDHLNTVRDVVKSDGSIVKHLEYNAFGELQGEPADELTFAYTGKLFDRATSLQWNINRWYDPKVGRWCSEDPIGFLAGDVNLARYVGNGVVGKEDALGLAVSIGPVEPDATCCKTEPFWQYMNYSSATECQAHQALMVALSTPGKLLAGELITQAGVAIYVQRAAWPALIADIALGIFVTKAIELGCDIPLCSGKNVKAPLCTTDSYQPWGSWGPTCHRIYCDCPLGYSDYDGGIKPTNTEVISWDIEEMKNSMH